MPNRMTPGKALLTADAEGDSKKAAIEPLPRQVVACLGAGL